MDFNKNNFEAKFAFEKGLEFLNNKDYENAEAKFLESLRLVPNRTSVVYNLVHIYYRSKNLKKLQILIIFC